MKLESICLFYFEIFSLECQTLFIEEERPPRTEPNVNTYDCPEGIMTITGRYTVNNKTYNEGEWKILENVK